jgi:hypothetical protein
MRAAIFLIGFVFLADSCNTVHHTSAEMKPAAPVVAAPAPTAPATQPVVVDIPAAPPTVVAEAPTSKAVTEVDVGPSVTPSTPAVSEKPATPAQAPATPPSPKPDFALATPAPALINPNVGNGANAPAEAQPPLPAEATLDQVLDALDARGQNLREFSAKVSLSSGDPLVEGVSTRVGQIYFQQKGPDDGRLRLVFDKRVGAGGTRADKTEYLLDKGWLIDRDYHKHTETNRQVVPPGGKMNLLKLGEGPFPLPIGQKKEEVKKQFDVTLIPPGKEDGSGLENSVHLKLVPKEGTRFFRRFGSINVWVDRRSNFPIRIDTVAPDDSDKHTTRLEDLKLNPQPPLKEEDFTLPMINKNVWTIHTEEYKE